MPLWKKFWLLFTVMWVVVSGLHVMTILAFSDEVEHGRALYSAAFGVLVPAAAYLLGWGAEKLKLFRGDGGGGGE